jgi:acyl-CoA synthetase (AMP-forming)/AMP-acid ligase II
MKEHVRTGHLVYIIIIAMIVLSFFLVIAFGGSESASTTMGTASTVSSLILSVIAIVLSLIDVAGQRQSVVDLKETAEKLAETNVKSQQLTDNILLKIEEITLLRDKLIEQINTNNEWKEEIKELLQGTKPEEVVEKVKEMIEIDTVNNYGLAELAGSVTINTSRANLYDVKKFLSTEYKYGETESLYSLINKLAREFSVPRSLSRQVVEELCKMKYLERYEISKIPYVKFLLV